MHPRQGRIASLAVPLALLVFACNSEPEAWQDATGADSIQSYEEYLDEFAQGEHAAEARERLVRLRDDDAFARARGAGTIDALEGYLEAYPEGGHREAATALLGPLYDDREWTSASEANSIDSYESYLAKYAEGAHAKDARAALEPLHKQRELRIQEALVGSWEGVRQVAAGIGSRKQVDRVVEAEEEVLLGFGKPGDLKVKVVLALRPVGAEDRKSYQTFVDYATHYRFTSGGRFVIPWLKTLRSGETMDVECSVDGDTLTVHLPDGDVRMKRVAVKSND